jgi:hypothetical protein
MVHGSRKKKGERTTAFFQEKGEEVCAYLHLFVSVWEGEIAMAETLNFLKKPVFFSVAKRLFKWALEN